MRYWLMKTEPSSFSVEDLAAAPRRTTAWDGVRNYQARNMLRDEMEKGDQAFLYYSSTEVPGIVAIMQIVQEGYPDPTAFDRKHHHTMPAAIRGIRAGSWWTCSSNAAWHARSRWRSCVRTQPGN